MTTTSCILKAVLLSLLAIQQVSADTCSAGTMPCGGGMCLDPTEVCVAIGTADETCCNPADVIPDTVPDAPTTAAVVTDATAATLAPGVTTTASSITTGSSVTTTSASCVDRVNPSTGVSDCPAMASYCNNADYLTLMTEQCPRTCGRCGTTTGNSTTCVDKVNPATGVSDCPRRAALCDDASYRTLMTEQCPRTCNRCTSTGSSTTATTSSTTCFDKVNPATGVSDCPRRAALCNDAAYRTLMTEQCPMTCGRCSSTGSSTGTTTASSSITSSSAPGTCVDRVNAQTGVSECPQRAALCTNSAYRTLMAEQCPRTCGLC